MKQALVDDLRAYYAALSGLTVAKRWDLAAALLAIEHGGGEPAKDNTAGNWYSVTDMSGLVSYAELRALANGGENEDEILTSFMRRSGKQAHRMFGVDPGHWYKVGERPQPSSIYMVRRELAHHYGDWNIATPEQIEEAWTGLSSERLERV